VPERFPGETTEGVAADGLPVAPGRGDAQPGLAAPVARTPDESLTTRVHLAFRQDPPEFALPPEPEAFGIDPLFAHHDVR